jgi:hypothetical protein
MIDDETKEKLLSELEKSGNVYLSCLKINVNKATYYRWKKDDKDFRKKSTQAEKLGRESNCDIAEHALMLNVKDRKLDAIKYVLSHNSPRYKGKQTSNVVILHKKESVIASTVEESWEESVEKIFEKEREKSVNVFNSFIYYHKVLPNKFDGSPIEVNEMAEYEGYIKSCYKMSAEEAEKKGITWRDISYYGKQI